MSIELGDKVKDPVTDFAGVAYTRITYLQGCDRIGIQALGYKNKEGEFIVPELFHVDEPQLMVLVKVKKSKKKVESGGPSYFGSSNKREIRSSK